MNTDIHVRNMCRFSMVMLTCLLLMTLIGQAALEGEGYTYSGCFADTGIEPHVTLTGYDVTVESCLASCSQLPNSSFAGLMRQPGDTAHCACAEKLGEPRTRCNGLCGPDNIKCGRRDVLYSFYQDVDECLVYNDSCAQQCVNGPGNFSCACYQGYEVVDNSTCEDIDECASVYCDHLCVNTLGSYRCDCNPGYDLMDDRVNCIDINECGSVYCDHLCVNTPGSYHCYCNPGYDLMNDRVNCIDVDECEGERFLCVGLGDNCVNTDGGYMCVPRESLSANPDGGGAIAGADDGRNLSVAASSGVAVGVIVVAVATAIIIVLVLRRRKQSAFVRGLPQSPSSVHADLHTNECAIYDQPDDGNRNMLEKLEMSDGPEENTSIHSTAIIAEVATETQPEIPPHFDPQITAISATDFLAYVNFMRKENGLVEQFKMLPLERTGSCSAAEQKGVSTKNKFKNILPYDETRVTLTIRDDNPLSDYINASFLTEDDDKIIASCGPREPTVDDFWRMVWEYDVPLVVMVTRVREGGVDKCVQYWPEDGATTYGDITVITSQTDKWLDIARRQLQITRGGERRQVLHLQYTAWPDHGVPTNVTSVINFAKHVTAAMTPSRYTIVHCSAGVGRTGTLVGLHQLMKQTAQAGVVDVFNCIKELRQRRMQMVQTAAQYVFIHDALAEIITLGDTKVSCSAFQDTHKAMRQITESQSAIEKQFHYFDNCGNHMSEEPNQYAMKADNRDKNRDMDVLPAKRRQVLLQDPFPGRNDYINAVFLDGYRKHGAYVVTQIPLHNTVIDFWRLIRANKTQAVVILRSSTDDGEMPIFLPEPHETLDVPPYDVTHIEAEYTKGVTVTHLRLEERDTSGVTYVNMETARQNAGSTLNVFTIHVGESMVLNFDDVIECYLGLKKWQNATGDKPIVVACRNGAVFSGQLVLCINLFEMMETEREVDIFQLVRQAKESRPEIISSLNQYRGLYANVESYIQTFDMYFNFK